MGGALSSGKLQLWKTIDTIDMYIDCARLIGAVERRSAPGKIWKNEFVDRIFCVCYVSQRLNEWTIYSNDKCCFEVWKVSIWWNDNWIYWLTAAVSCTHTSSKSIVVINRTGAIAQCCSIHRMEWAPGNGGMGCRLCTMCMSIKVTLEQDDWNREW